MTCRGNLTATINPGKSGPGSNVKRRGEVRLPRAPEQKPHYLMAVRVIRKIQFFGVDLTLLQRIHSVYSNPQRLLLRYINVILDVDAHPYANLHEIGVYLKSHLKTRKCYHLNKTCIVRFRNIYIYIYIYRLRNIYAPRHSLLWLGLFKWEKKRENACF